MSPRTAILVSICLSAINGCSSNLQPSSVPARSYFDPPPKATVSDNGRKTITVTPIEFFAECAKDNDAADAKYRGKLIELIGTIKEVEHGASSDTVSINIEASDDPKLYQAFIDCELTPESSSFDKAIALSPGRAVKVKGEYHAAFKYGPRIVNCEILSASPDPLQPIAMKAETLSKAFALDTNEARKDYEHKQMTVEGVYLRNDPVLRVAILQGHDPKSDKPYPVKARYLATQSEAISKLKPGSRIKLAGKCDGFTHDDMVALCFARFVK